MNASAKSTETSVDTFSFVCLKIGDSGSHNAFTSCEIDKHEFVSGLCVSSLNDSFEHENTVRSARTVVQSMRFSRTSRFNELHDF